jgi:hypothetical protein
MQKLLDAGVIAFGLAYWIALWWAMSDMLWTLL